MKSSHCFAEVRRRHNTEYLQIESIYLDLLTGRCSTNGYHPTYQAYRSVARRRLVLQRKCAGDLVRLCWVECLPDPVDAVKHSVVEPKDRIIDRRVEVGRITAHGIMSGGMQTKEAVWVSTLNLGPEIAVRLGTRANGHIQYVRTNIAAQATRVIVGDIGRQVREALHAGRDWTDVRLRTRGLLVFWLC
jgi:hypothetical protein